MINQLQQTKLAYLAQKLGFDLKDTQQTHRRVYDTVPAAGVGRYSFFTDFAGKTLQQTNLTSGKLDSSEAFVIKQITVSDNDDASYFRFGAFLSVIVGGQTVVKKLPLQFFADDLHFEQLTQTIDAGTGNYIPSFRLLTNIIVPPQVEFEVQLETFADPLVPVSCMLDGFGVIFNPQMSL